jgi:hypothetical protein
LTVDELDIFLSSGSDNGYEILALYTFRNPSNTVVTVSVGSQQEIPFLKFPVGAQGLGYEAVQDSARFTSTADGFAMPPSDQPYGLIAYSSIPKDKEITISQPLDLAVTHVRIFIPDGMKAKGELLTEDSPQDIQGVTYQSYFATGLNAGSTLDFTISGTPNDSSGTSATTNNKTLLMGAAGLGTALILAGAWMYLRDRRRTGDEEDPDDGSAEDDDEEEDEFESSEDVMDAIIALDDLYRARKISDEAYHKRREELKEILKEMM